MVDGRHHVAFAGQVFTQVAHEVAVARVAVRNDDQREGAAGAVGLRVAHGFAQQGDFGFAVTCDGAVLAGRGLASGEFGGVPDLQGQRSVIAGQGLAGFGLDDVELLGVDDLERLHAHRVFAVGGQSRRVGADGVYVVVFSQGGGRCTRQQQKSRDACGYYCFQHVYPLS